MPLSLLLLAPTYDDKASAIRAIYAAGWTWAGVEGLEDALADLDDWHDNPFDDNSTIECYVGFGMSPWDKDILNSIHQNQYRGAENTYLVVNSIAHMARVVRGREEKSRREAEVHAAQMAAAERAIARHYPVAAWDEGDNSQATAWSGRTVTYTVSTHSITSNAPVPAIAPAAEAPRDLVRAGPAGQRFPQIRRFFDHLIR